MSQSHSNDRRLTSYKSSDEELRQDLIKQVLAATTDAARATTGSSRNPRYDRVVELFSGSRLEPDTVAAALVCVALEDWIKVINLPGQIKVELIRDIAHALCSDPLASISLEKFWRELQETRR